MSSIPDIYHIGGEFLIFEENHARRLRDCRIVAQLVGCSPKVPHQIVTSGLPGVINHYAVGIILRDRIANFKTVAPRDNSQNLENHYLEKLEELREEARKEFVNKRAAELAKRNIEVKLDRIGNFDEKKIRITLKSTPALDYSSFNVINLEGSQISSLLRLEDRKWAVFENLYDRGFYVTSGMKFGSDFLAYLGDPVRYHAQYAIKVVANLEGSVDLSKISYNEINASNRLCHGANKISLLAVVCDETRRVKYWTLKEREYLNPDSNATAFELVNPTLNSI